MIIINDVFNQPKPADIEKKTKQNKTKHAISNQSCEITPKT
jgi:hypothetical protein